MERQVQTQQWHVAQWGTWGWIETVLKLMAIVTGFAAFAVSLSSTVFLVTDNPHLGSVIALSLLTLSTIIMLRIRYSQREIISVLFALLNLLGHGTLLIALLRIPDQRVFFFIFGAFFVLGQLAKLRFLSVSGYTENGASTSSMIRITAILTVFYLLFLLFLLL